MNEKEDVDPLSNYDLIKIVSKDLKDRANIIDTTKPHTYNDFNDLWKGRGHCILFENPNKKQVGHWTALLRQKAKGKKKERCMYIDSYGGKIKDKKLKQILKKKYDYIEYNPYQLQEFDSNYCGYYVFLLCALNKIIPDLDMHKILSFFNSKNKNISFDEFVHDLTENIDI